MQPAEFDRLHASFGLAGEEFDCDARTPIAITGSTDIWVLLSGHVDGLPAAVAAGSYPAGG